MPSEKPNEKIPPGQEIPATRLFKVLNPELYMKPNRAIMYGGALAMVGVVYWLGSKEMEYRRAQEKLASDSQNSSAAVAQPRQPTYQEQMAQMKSRSSSSTS
ncbi:hypothetical protein GGI07_000304 [Coemansia sp. Benny D115]|nr:hypothetical protein GGI07_000304 [Coemansia sp. Benny D115]